MKSARVETVAQKQARFNRSTRDHWMHFTAHRARVQELILTGRPAGRHGSFISLGAGNCNDLELRKLLDAFEQVHLVDLDRQALSAAADRQGVTGAPGLVLHAPIDLTGISDLISRWKTQVPNDRAVSQAVTTSATACLPAFDITFDVVLSSCVLSQLVAYAVDTLGGDAHAGFRDLVCAIRARHLRTVAALLKPGGTGILVCDLVSSDTRPELSRFAEHELGGYVQKLARDGTFFSGLHPDAVAAALKSEADAPSPVTDVRLLPPWLWQLGPARSFLVYALRFRRAPAEGSMPKIVLG